MLIIGCDFHTRYQQIAMAREGTAELLLERRLDHESGEAHAFYRNLQSSHEPVLVGIEATGPIHWFERLLAELGHELWIGDSAKIRAQEVRKQKTDERDSPIAELDRAVLEEAKRRDDAVLLMTHPGIGPVTSLAFVLAVGPVTRFHRSRKLVSYFGLNPTEESSGGRRRLGAISKQGNTMVRWLLIETVHHAVRQDPELKQDYQRLKFRRGHAVAKVAIARKLAVRMYWMLRSGADYARLVRRQGSPGATLVDASPSLG